eukprot:TRINITY_DN2009_c0_g2_i3.p1 TRINITY_DN2009_c0_g2~~TRINITY_DN2009_c0_g2_i3.p1  ORF type:complete len:145 (-),score=50.12 TRINITY_DN2009_c0_g2_i3:84-518(-)
MKPFAKSASETLSRLETLLKESEDLFKKVLAYFCEEPKTTPEEFFEVLERFHGDFEKARKDNKQAKEKAAKQAASGGGAAAGQPRGQMDTLISSLHNTDALRSKRAQRSSAVPQAAEVHAGKPPPGAIRMVGFAMPGMVKKTDG